MRHPTPDIRRASVGVSRSGLRLDVATDSTMTVLASCAVGAPANCEDRTDPIGMLVVGVVAVVVVATLVVLLVAGRPGRRRAIPARRRGRR